MPLPLPQIGDRDVRGFVLPSTCAGSVCALSIYGDYPANAFNPLIYYATEDLTARFAVGAEVVFDIAPFAVSGDAYATNVRAA